MKLLSTFFRTGSVILVLLHATLLKAQDSTLTPSPIQVSVIQGFGSHGLAAKNHQYTLSCNLLSGTTGSIEGIEIGGLLNHNKYYMHGVQVGGLANITQGSVRGVQVGGMLNVSDTTKGIQVGGLTNISDYFEGIQVAGLVNKATSLNGVQVAGLVNIAGRMDGIQVGLLNINDTVGKGLPIGLLNIVRKGGWRELSVSTADYQHIGLSYRLGVKQWYTMLNIGYNDRPDALLSAGLGFGHARYWSPKSILRFEATSYTYLPRKADDFSMSFSAAHFGIGFTRKIGQVLAITFMPSLYVAFREEDSDHDDYTFSRIKPMLEYEYKNGQIDMGIGFSVGISFLRG